MVQRLGSSENTGSTVAFFVYSICFPPHWVSVSRVAHMHKRTLVLGCTHRGDRSQPLVLLVAVLYVIQQVLVITRLTSSPCTKAHQTHPSPKKATLRPWRKKGLKTKILFTGHTSPPTEIPSRQSSLWETQCLLCLKKLSRLVVGNGVRFEKYR